MIIKEKDGYCLLKVIVQPRAGKSCIAEIQDNALKVKVTSPPVKGAANRECIEVMAKALKTKKGTIEVIGGHNSRRKTLKIELSLASIKKALQI